MRIKHGILFIVIHASQVLNIKLLAYFLILAALEPKEVTYRQSLRKSPLRHYIKTQNFI